MELAGKGIENRLRGGEGLDDQRGGKRRRRKYLPLCRHLVSCGNFSRLFVCRHPARRHLAHCQLLRRLLKEIKLVWDDQVSIN